MTTETSQDKLKKQYKKIFKRFHNVTKEPESFLSVQPEKAIEIKAILSDLYGISVRENDAVKDPNILPELILHGMDEEQIWQQLELYNNSVWPQLLEETSKTLAINDDNFLVTIDEGLDEQSLDENDENEDLANSDEEQIHEENYTDDEFNEDVVIKNKPKKPKRKSIVDDKFFKLSEMEEFLNEEDQKERLKEKGLTQRNEDEIDYFNDNLSDEGDEELKYKDFFDPIDEDEGDEFYAPEGESKKSRKKRKHSDSSYFSEEVENEEDFVNDLENEEELGDMGEEYLDREEEDIGEEEELEDNRDNESIEEGSFHDEEINSDDDDESKPKSSYEIRQKHLKNKIKELEEKALSEKPWQLKGEITATSRPQNSLLEEVLQFDANAQPAPVVTEKTTMRLEDIIKQRILNKAWDDPVRTVRPIQTPQEFRKKLVLDQEKSKESLTQIYEKEYRKELEKLDPNNEHQPEEPKEHKEIKEMMRSLFIKLDALSNFHYTPKPVAPEPKIITNTPAINMEEVAPVAVSDAKLLAPEEIKSRPKGDVLGKSERSRTDKNRERRKKKLRQSAIYKAREERELEKQKMGIKLTKKEEKDRMLRKVTKDRNVKKMKMSSDMGSLKSSKAFFSQLQDTTTSKTSKFKKDSDRDKSKLTAKKLKL